jgi:hypothetical protein
MAGLADALGTSIIVDVEGPDAPIEHEDGTIETPTEDGGVVVSFNPGRKEAIEAGKDDPFNRNLAPKLNDARLSNIAETLLEQIEADNKSRSEWLTTLARAIDLLGLKLEDPSGSIGSMSAPMEGMSTNYDTLLIEAVLRARATACGELLPAAGPVKIENVGTETGDTVGQAEAMERDFNYWLTSVDKSYYPDTRRLLFWSSFSGSGFKKGYHCPLKRRPVIESVNAKNVIVSAEATDCYTAARVTHEISMRPSIMRRMQVLDVYRNVPLAPATKANKTEPEQAEQRVAGIVTGDERPEDTPYQLYESYCEVDIDEFAPQRFKGKRLPLPYRITLEKESHVILDIRRDWEEDDEECQRKRTWVKYPYVEALGFYCLGLMHILGNTTNALTAGGRMSLDTGMMANFPGLLIAKWAARQTQENTNIRVNAGEAAVVDTGDRPISDAVMGMPYKDVTAGLLAVLDKLRANGQRVGGTADLPVGEGRQDAPVGTTIALIEQATKVESDVHKGLHQAQSEEFEILKRLFREDPEAFWRHNKKCTMQWDADTFLKALDSCNLVPRADPNTPSHIHRLMKCMALKQLQAANPQLYNGKEVDSRILRMLHWDDVDSLFAPTPSTPPPPDPLMITAQAKAKDADTRAKSADIKGAEIGLREKGRQEELAAEESLEDKRIAKELIIHGDQHALATAGHGLDVAQAGHDAALDQAGHNLETETAAHEAALGVASHALDVRQAMQPPQPKTTP